MRAYFLRKLFTCFAALRRLFWQRIGTEYVGIIKASKRKYIWILISSWSEVKLSEINVTIGKSASGIRTMCIFIFYIIIVIIIEKASIFRSAITEYRLLEIRAWESCKIT